MSVSRITAGNVHWVKCTTIGGKGAMGGPWSYQISIVHLPEHQRISYMGGWGVEEGGGYCFTIKGNTDLFRDHNVKFAWIYKLKRLQRNFRIIFHSSPGVPIPYHLYSQRYSGRKVWEVRHETDNVYPFTGFYELAQRRTLRTRFISFMLLWNPSQFSARER